MPSTFPDGRLGSPRIERETCSSTQALLLGSGLPEGAVAVTDHQTAGRGRLGRTWREPRGTALLVSVLLRPPAERPAQQLTLVTAVAVAETVDAAGEQRAEIKWPNDVLVAGRKVAGILAERRGAEVVVGIGLNVNQTDAELPADTRRPAASLRTLTGREHDRAALLDDLLARLDRVYRAWLAEGLRPLADEIASRDVLRGRAVRHDGVAATARGIDPEGRLVLELADGGRTAVSSGEIETAH